MLDDALPFARVRSNSEDRHVFYILDLRPIVSVMRKVNFDSKRPRVFVRHYAATRGLGIRDIRKVILHTC